jgi:hypothetical protein
MQMTINRKLGVSLTRSINKILLILYLRLAEGQSVLQKKGCGRLIHVSDFINQETGCLVVYDQNGTILQDARKIIYPGSNGDPWWNTDQLLAQVKEAISIFEIAHPKSQALFIFDQSSAHASLADDALKAFEMNKSDGGKQQHQHDTYIPKTGVLGTSTPPQVQKMTTEDGRPRGLKSVLEERGYDVSKMKAKCSPVCPFENTTCCMARLLSKEEDFINQPSQLETLISGAGHICIFLPKFHCELNPIEMVSVCICSDVQC